MITLQLKATYRTQGDSEIEIGPTVMDSNNIPVRTVSFKYSPEMTQVPGLQLTDEETVDFVRI